MVTLRVHLDAVSNTNAPLKVALGSHRFGKIPHDKIEAMISDCSILECEANAGDIWVYSTPIVHASDKAILPNNRRVLQIDFSSTELPATLSWAGI